jgi:flagellum-specific ATP synthase
MPDIASVEHRDAAQSIRELMAVYRDHEDLISIGAYRQGANRQVDVAIELLDEINKYLRQKVEEPSTLESTLQKLIDLCKKAVAKLTSQP